MEQEIEQKTYKLTELVEFMRSIHYPQANDQKIKWYAKQRVIYPRRLDPTNPKSKYVYTDRELHELQILFTFMMVCPFDIAKEMLTIIRANIDFARALSDDEFVAALKRAPMDVEQEPWKTFFEKYTIWAGEEMRLEKQQIREKINDAITQINQAYLVLKDVVKDLELVNQILEQPDRKQLIEQFANWNPKPPENK